MTQDNSQTGGLSVQYVSTRVALCALTCRNRMSSLATQKRLLLSSPSQIVDTTCVLFLAVSLQAAVKSLIVWRAAAAAAGDVHILTTLSQAEVAALTKQQAEAVGQKIMQLEARGRLLMRRAAARQLVLGDVTAEDAAALTWKLHTGGEDAVQELTTLLLAQVG